MISKSNILDLKLRRDIYQFISDNPALNISEISQKANIPRSTLRHHLRYLIKSTLITVKVDGKNKRFYTYDRVGTKGQEILSLFRQEIPFKIIMYLYFPGFCSKAELAKDLKVHPSTIHFHIRKLLDMDVIKPIEVKDGWFISSQEHKPTVFKKPVGREIFYTWKNSEILRDVYDLLITHKESMSDPSVIDAYNDFIEGWGRKRIKKYFTFNSSIDNIVNILGEICYFRFHF